MPTTILNAKQLRILRDLGEKYPKGPQGTIRRDHYTTRLAWSGVYRREVNTVFLREDVPSTRCAPELRSFFGYNPVDIFAMRLADEDEVKSAMRNSFPKDTAQAANRRGRLAWTRIAPARRYVQDNGTEGLWHVSYRQAGYGSPLYGGLRFHAVSKAAALAQATVIAPMLGANPSWTPDVRFSDLGGPEEAIAFNTAVVQRRTNELTREIKGLEERLAKARAELALATEEAGRAMGAVMLGIGDDSEDAEVA